MKAILALGLLALLVLAGVLWLYYRPTIEFTSN